MYYFRVVLWRLALYWNLLCSYLKLYGKCNLFNVEYSLLFLDFITIRIEIAKAGFATNISITTYYEFFVMSQYNENNNLNQAARTTDLKPTKGWARSTPLAEAKKPRPAELPLRAIPPTISVLLSVDYALHQ